MQIALIKTKSVMLWQQPTWKLSMVDIRFAPEGNNIAKPMFYRQIQADGSYKPIITHKDMDFPRKVNY